jgi:hypothetical protein
MSDYEKIIPPENSIESENEITVRLKVKLSQKYAEPLEQKMKTVEHIADYADRLRAKYPDPTAYRLFHILGFSTPDPSISFTNFDFPGEDSVQAFIERL